MRQIKRYIRQLVWLLRFYYLRYVRGIDLDITVRIGRSVIFDRTYPQGIHIGRQTYITNNVTVLTHDHASSEWELHTVIGERCFVGNMAIILPGITVGNEAIIGAGSVVTKDVPSNCIVAGNPARIIKRGIRMNEDARIIDEPVDNHEELPTGSEQSR